MTDRLTHRLGGQMDGARFSASSGPI